MADFADLADYADLADLAELADLGLHAAIPATGLFLRASTNALTRQGSTNTSYPDEQR